MLPEAPLPAFRSVSHAALIYENTFPHLQFCDQFPNLDNLDLEFVVSDVGGPSLPDYFDLRAPPLRSLVIEDGNLDSSASPLLDAIERSVDLSAIPIVLVLGDTVRWNEMIHTDDKAEVSVRVNYDREDLLVHVAPEHRRWRRMFRLSFWDTDSPLPIGEIPNLPGRLTFLRMDTWVIHGFLRLELSFAALRSLHIDFRGDLSEQRSLQPPDYDAGLDLVSFSGTTPDAPRVWAPCPLLEEITLFALHKPVTAVDSRRVAFLAHALGQFARPDAQRAALTLVGIEFAQPPATALLGQTVSAIRRSAFAGRGSREDFDEGLWDYRLFNRDLVGSSAADDN